MSQGILPHATGIPTWSKALETVKDKALPRRRCWTLFVLAAKHRTDDPAHDSRKISFQGRLKYCRVTVICGPCWLKERRRYDWLLVERRDWSEVTPHAPWPLRSLHSAVRNDMKSWKCMIQISSHTCAFEVSGHDKTLFAWAHVPAKTDTVCHTSNDTSDHVSFRQLETSSCFLGNE